MKVNGKNYRTIWIDEKNKSVVKVIDQTKLPFEFVIIDLKTVDDVCVAIKDMIIRGAGLIGATAAYGMYLAALENSSDVHLKKCGDNLKETRPTAINLAYAVDRMIDEISKGKSDFEKKNVAFNASNRIADEDANFCKRIGEHGVKLIEEISKKKNGETVNILTHCNAGWLAFVDYGSATSPIYAAFDKGIKVHVWVDETRPRNQGAFLTAWEIKMHGVPHHVIADNTGGHLMQHGLVDIVIVGSDRTTYTGDVCNKIGTYLKALAAKDNNIPFYAALPSSTFDWNMKDGVNEIPIEKRSGDEVTRIRGLCKNKIEEVLITTSDAVNYGFDVTPRRFVTGIITERGICKADEKSILSLFPEKIN